MEPITLLDAARQVLLYMAPLIAGGALAKIGEDLTDTSLHLLDRAWSLVQGRLADDRKARSKLASYETDPEDAQQRQVVEGEVVRVFQADAEASQALLALAREIAALQPRTQQEGNRSVTVTGNAKIGLVNQGNVAGDFHAGPIDMRSKTFLTDQSSESELRKFEPTGELVELQNRLVSYRATLDHYLDQLSMVGETNARPEMTAGIRTARAEIRRVKTYLRSKGQQVEDEFNDEE
jgi:hypothetical protein